MRFWLQTRALECSTPCAQYTMHAAHASSTHMKQLLATAVLQTHVSLQRAVNLTCTAIDDGVITGAGVAAPLSESDIHPN
jgi:hypothetical protein